MNLRTAACASSIRVSILFVGAFGSPACLSRSAALEVMPWTPLRNAAPPSVVAETARIQVRVYALSPQSGPVGTSVTITGFGFTNDNAIHFGDRVILHVAVKSAIGIACTPNPNCRGGIRQTLAFPIPDAPPGPYRVWVENSHGNSNAATFTVTKS